MSEIITIKEFTDIFGVKHGVYFVDNKLFVRRDNQVKTLIHLSDGDELSFVTTKYEDKIKSLWETK